jgi:Protein of unknown function (DUF1236)
MKAGILAAAVCAALLLSGARAEAQARLSPEQIAKIRDHVRKENRPSGAVPRGYRVSVGAAVPETLPLHSFPTALGVPGYRYAVVGNQIVLVALPRRLIYQVWGVGY